MTKTEWVERNRDGLEKAYSDLYLLCISEKDEALWDDLHKYEAALVNLGILEGDAPMEEAEDTNESFNWDEWNWDMKVDELREQMAYER